MSTTCNTPRLTRGTADLAALRTAVAAPRGGAGALRAVRGGAVMRASLRRDRKAAVALMVGVMSPMLLGFLGMTVDAGFWIIGQTRLQVSADAAAMGTSFLLQQAAFKSMDATSKTNAMNAVAKSEAYGAMTRMFGTLVTPLTVSWASDYTWVTVTLYSQASSYFAPVFNIAPPMLRATATASIRIATPCALTLGMSGIDIQVDNSGTLTGASCGIGSKSTGNPSIYLNSGTISATSIVAAGTVTTSNSGTNTMSPSNPTQNSSSVPSDPYATNTAPTPGTCVSHPDYTQNGTYVANPGTWCGDQVIGGNGSTITFNPGVYIIKNGDLTFNNASITSALGVTFVLAGSSPGSFSWTNYSNTTQFTAPTSGATAGFAIWQVCHPGSGQTSSFQGGGTVLVTGAFYMPCSSVDVGNNAQVKAPLNGQFTLVSKTLYVHGSAIVALASSGAGSTGATAMLTQ